MKRNFFPLPYFVIPFLNINLFCQPYSAPVVTAYQSSADYSIVTKTGSITPGILPDVGHCIETLNKKTPVDLEFNKEVEKAIDYYLAKRRIDIELYIQR